MSIEVYVECADRDLRRSEPTRLELAREPLIIPSSGWRQNPRFIRQFGNIDLTPALRPTRLHACHYDQRIVKNRIDVDVVHLGVDRQRKRPACENKIELPLA